MKKADLFIIISVLAVAGILCFFLYGSNTPGAVCTVEVDGKITDTLPLNEDSETVIKTEHGSNTLVIKDGKAEITEADCPDKICQKHSAIYRNGESIICLPHKVVISIENEKESGVDAVA